MCYYHIVTNKGKKFDVQVHPVAADGGGRTCGRSPSLRRKYPRDLIVHLLIWGPKFLLLFDTRVYEAHYPGIVNNCI